MEWVSRCANVRDASRGAVDDYHPSPWAVNSLSKCMLSKYGLMDNSDCTCSLFKRNHRRAYKLSS
eukprot:5700310-Amphidinium_carterae.2